MIYNWIVSNELLSDPENGKRGFNITYRDIDLPDFLNFCSCTKYNVYHVIGLILDTDVKIDAHIDCELMSHRHQFLTLPNTYIYYVDIDENMKGGDLVIESDTVIRPVSNMAIVNEAGIEHSVTEIKYCSKPRIMLVCERYRFFKRYYDALRTPIYAKG